MLVRIETAAVRMLPPPLLYWPPVQRIIETRPGYRDAVGLRHIVLALGLEVVGDASAWSDLLGLLRQAGFLLPGDPPRPRLQYPVDLADAGQVRPLSPAQKGADRVLSADAA